MISDRRPARIYLNAPNHTGKSGSMEHYAVLLADAYAQLGHEVVFCSGRRTNGVGTRTVHLPAALVTRLNRLNMLLLYGAILIDILRRSGRDFAITNISQEFVFPAFLRKSLILIHDTIQSEYPRSRAITWLLAINWRLVRRAGKCVCISHTTRLDLAAMGIDAEAVYVPFDEAPSMSAPVPAADRTTDAVWCGTLAAHKDFATFLDLALRNPDLRLCAIVPAADAAALAATTVPANLTIRHTLTPMDYEQQLRSSHVLVSTSRKEGYGMPPMEALMRGVPVLLSDIPVYREIYGEVADFFPPGDGAALARHLRTMLDRPRDVTAAPAILERYRGNIDDYIRDTDRLVAA